MKDKLNITIKLADHKPISLSDVTPGEEELMREAEYNINRLWRSWCQEFPDKEPDEVLAMVAFQFARHYYGQLREMKEVEEVLAESGRRLDEIVLRLDEPQSFGAEAHRPQSQE